VDSVTNSFTARLANVPTHKSVGKNGTFWLPPESANSFSSKLKDLSKKNSRSPSKNSQNNPALPNAQAKQDGSANAKSNLTVSRNLNRTETPRNSHILQSTQSHSKPKKVSNNSGVQVQSNLLPRALHGDSSIIGKNQVSRGVEKKSPETENLLSKDKENQMLVGDKEEHEGQKNTKHHGAKDAFSSDLMHMTERLNLIFTQAASIAKSENRLEDKSLKLLEDIAREVATKIALLEKDESKIVRMAFDLPNGSALSVRIEQTPSNLSISFITQDAETQDVIEFIQELLGRDQNNSHASSISVFLFQSYQDMDSYFKQAA
tara:strand:+ start:217 stop:1173 length:957 start_codon:yes stop_codon:yes gene_type:complete